MSTTRHAVLSAYRSLVRVEFERFGGDAHTLRAALCETRRQFEAGRGETDPERLAQLLAKAQEVAQFLRRNVIQGIQVSGEETGRYRLLLTADHEVNDRIPLSKSAKPCRCS